MIYAVAAKSVDDSYETESLYSAPAILHSTSLSNIVGVRNLPNQFYWKFRQRKLEGCLTHLENMKALTDNWNGYDVPKPDNAAINAAIFFMEQLFNFCKCSDLSWTPPAIAAGSTGEVVFEWFCGKKKLAIYIEPHAIAYIKASDSNIEHMEDGILRDINLTVYSNLFGWLEK